MRFLPLFATDDEVQSLETAPDDLSPLAACLRQIELAWQLRERDTRRALAWVDQLRRMVAPFESALPAGDERPQLRLQLIQAYGAWVFAELERAQSLSLSLLAQSVELSQACIWIDAQMLLAGIAGDRGDVLARIAALELAAERAKEIGDPLRQRYAQLNIAMAEIRRDPQHGMARWGELIHSLQDEPHHPALRLMCHECLSYEAYMRADYSAVFHHCHQVIDKLAHVGMKRWVVLSLSTMGAILVSLHDNAQGLEWMQRGLEMARPTGWPLSVGMALNQTVTVLIRLGRLDAAEQLLAESLRLLAPLRDSRTYLIAVQYQAELHYACKRYDATLAVARELVAQAEQKSMVDLQLNAMQLWAQALLAMERSDEALSLATEGLRLAQQYGEPLVIAEALETLALIHSRFSLPAPEGMAEASPALHYLLQSLAALPAAQEVIVPPSLLDAIAREYAKVGDTGQAYEFAVRANAERERNHGQDVTNRLLSLEARFQAERATEERAHLQQLATVAAERAELMAQTSATLEGLSVIGQQITGQLNEQRVYETLDHNVHGLLPAQHFAIYLMNDAAQQLDLAFGREDGALIAPFSVPLSHATAYSTRCALEGRELLIDVDPVSHQYALAPGTHQTLSAMFMPLIVKERLLGVVSVQSHAPQAYAERERLIFRSLCAYGAIAIDNARNYRRMEAALQSLHEAQSQLVSKNLELERAYAALEDISLTDPLTGMRNRRFLEQHLDAEVALCVRHYSKWLRHPETGTPNDADLLFFLLDIDHFKRVNDTHGHPAGDQVLIQMRARLASVFRESDYLVRWGGEEFLVVARAMGREEAAGMAERIRTAVSGLAFDIGTGSPLNLSCSVGFAAFPFVSTEPEWMNWQQVLGMADQALYHAKHLGRNAWVGFTATARTLEAGDPLQLAGAPLPSAEQGLLRIESNRAPS